MRPRLASNSARSSSAFQALSSCHHAWLSLHILIHDTQLDIAACKPRPIVHILFQDRSSDKITGSRSLNIFMVLDKCFQVVAQRVTNVQSHLHHGREVFSLDSRLLFFNLPNVQDEKWHCIVMSTLFLKIANELECF